MWGWSDVAPGHAATTNPVPPVREPRAQREVLTAASPMPCLPGHSCTGPPTMASDHQTPAGKPQPLNPKVGTTWEEGVASTVPLGFPAVKWGWCLPFWGFPSLGHSLPSLHTGGGADSEGPSPAHD